MWIMGELTIIFALDKEAYLEQHERNGENLPNIKLSAYPKGAWHHTNPVE